MKKITSVVTVLLAVLLMAQEKPQFLEVHYHSTMDLEAEEVLKQVPSQYRAMVEDQIKQELADGIHIDYTLKTDGNESVYDMVEQISNAQGQGGMIAQQIKQFDKGTLYKNIAENYYLKPIELPGQSFLLKDTLQEMHWQISREKENIAGYEARKANGWFTYQNDTVNVTAWYAPKLAIKDGPSNIQGLPGLVLKTEFNMNNADVTIVALNIKAKEEEIEIKKPNKGKEITQKELEEEIKIMQEKYKEMMGEGVDTED